MKRLAFYLSAMVVCCPTAQASECGRQIQAIERRMHSAGAARITGEKPSPASKSQASNAAGRAPDPVNPSQKPSLDKMEGAAALIQQAKAQDQKGDKDGCERTMMNAQQAMGALP